MTEKSPVNAYLRTRVLTASPEELRLLLLEGAIKFASQAREGLEAKNYEASYTGITSCRNIVLELLTTIKAEHDPVLAERVKGVYTFIYVTLVEASMERNIAKLDSAIKLLQFERETWQLLLEKLREGRASGDVSDADEAIAETVDARPALSIQG